MSEVRITDADYLPTEARRHVYQDFNGPHQVRLLQAWIEPSTERIIAKFTHVDLSKDSNVRYRAFSYCWGDPTPFAKVWFADGSYLEVAASAAAIIKTIAENPMHRTYNWIDAVCIDQENPDEKGHQVRQMRDVYAKAKQVMIWLDEEKCDGETAFKHLSKVYNSLTPLIQSDSPVNIEVVQNLPELEHPSPGWTALARILDCSYFQRIWVIQEIVMATSPVIIISKGSTILYQAVEDLVWNMNTAGLEPLLHIDFPSGRRGPRGWATLIKLRLARDRWSKGIRADLHGTLVGWSHCLASDPRDKIYALLSISLDGESDVLRPDYRISTEHLYVKTARYLLTQGQSLLMLSCAGIAAVDRLASLPSWVPDWTCIPHGRNLASYAEWSKYNANGATSCSTSSTEDNTLLTVEGRRIDQVDQLLPRDDHKALNPADHVKQQFQWLESAKQFISRSHEKYRDPAMSSAILWRTLIANADEHELPAASDYGTSFEAYLERFRQGRHQISVTSGALKYALAVRSFWVSDRTLFKTKGGLIGIVSKRVQPGDQVSIFHGAHMPYVLRGTSKDNLPTQNFLLVAQSYIHGLMNGEGLELGKPEKIRLV